MSFSEVAQILGNLGEFFGAIAVVVTLVYLARQVHQNTSSVKAAAYQTWLSSNVDINLATMSPRFSESAVKGLYDSKQLDEDSFLMFALWNHSCFQLLQATDYMYQLGALDQELWESEMSRAAIHLDLPGVRQWWDAGGNTQLAPTFVRLVEEWPRQTIRYAWNATDGFFPDPAHAQGATSSEVSAS